jgi:hypothetical protein
LVYVLYCSDEILVKYTINKNCILMPFKLIEYSENIKHRGSGCSPLDPDKISEFEYRFACGLPYTNEKPQIMMNFENDFIVRR